MFFFYKKIKMHPKAGLMEEKGDKTYFCSHQEIHLNRGENGVEITHNALQRHGCPWLLSCSFFLICSDEWNIGSCSPLCPVQSRNISSLFWWFPSFVATRLLKPRVCRAHVGESSPQALHWVSWHCKGYCKLLMVSLPVSTANGTVSLTLSAQIYTVDLFEFLCLCVCCFSVLFHFCAGLCVFLFMHVSTLVNRKHYICVCAAVGLSLVLLLLFLWVIGIQLRPFTHSDIEIITVAAPSYLPRSCVSACVCAARSPEWKRCHFVCTFCQCFPEKGGRCHSHLASGWHFVRLFFTPNVIC